VISFMMGATTGFVRVVFGLEAIVFIVAV